VRYATALIALLPLACAHGRSSDPASPGRLSEDIATNAEWRRSMRIIDVHGHISPASVEKALAAMDAHFIDRLVNLTAGSTIEQFTAAKQVFEEKGRGRFILYINDVYGNQPIEDPEFGRKVTETLERAAALGAKGLKISKSLGLYWKDQDKKIVPIDDPRLDPMWATAGRLGLPVSIHSGDPKAFWQPIDEKNERYEELHEHPDWAFGGGAYPPREEILRQLEAVVARHPKVTFVGVHFGNDPEDVDHVAALFRRYPNYNADLGARIPEIGRQDPAKLRAMFVEFQDRILFGTDFMVFPRGYILGAGPVLTDEAEVTRFFDAHWRFLETNARKMQHPTPIQGRWTVDAIGLPPEVLEKIYRKNAERIILKQ
jgi:predicted TIM-barrel fold metal-dependent hydrolase